MHICFCIVQWIPQASHVHPLPRLKGVREEAARRVTVPRERAFIPGLSEPAQREIVGQWSKTLIVVAFTCPLSPNQHWTSLSPPTNTWRNKVYVCSRVDRLEDKETSHKHWAEAFSDHSVTFSQFFITQVKSLSLHRMYFYTSLCYWQWIFTLLLFPVLGEQPEDILPTVPATRTYAPLNHVVLSPG